MTRRRPNVSRDSGGQAITPREQRMLEILITAAGKGDVCPSNDQICSLMGMQSIGSPPTVMNKLVQRGLILVERFGNSRIVTIVATDKSTAGERGVPHFSTRANHVPVHRLSDGEAALFKSELEDYLVRTGTARVQLSLEALGHGNGVQNVLAARNPQRDTAQSFREAMLRRPDGYPPQVRGSNIHNVAAASAVHEANIKEHELAERRGEGARRHVEHVLQCETAHREKYGDAPFGKSLSEMVA